MTNRFIIIGWDHGNSELIETNDFDWGQRMAVCKKKDKNFEVVYAGSLINLIDKLEKLEKLKG